MNPTLYPFHKKLWLSFKDGFRDSNEDFYLGNKWIRAMTEGKQITMTAIGFKEGAWGGEKYNSFNIGTEDNAYELVTSGRLKPSLTPRIGFRMNDKRKFVTIDRDGEKMCSTQAFKGEGYAGWENTGDDCHSKYRWYPNAIVPQRTDNGGAIERYDASILMFREKP
ncbi:ryncolin-1-like [Clytia hemisphaerica]|uniref:ryncolin-1-like n=1 Tax=Clytia hemisphaerica TaxID=252671 RepID=UPI0034D5CB1E